MGRYNCTAGLTEINPDSHGTGLCQAPKEALRQPLYRKSASYSLGVATEASARGAFRWQRTLFRVSRSSETTVVICGPAK
jgi:hypothetical protein